MRKTLILSSLLFAAMLPAQTVIGGGAGAVQLGNGNGLPLTGGTLSGPLVAPAVNGIMNPASCASSSPASWCSGSDACGYIAAAFTALGSNGGTVDARSYTGNQACSSNPFATLLGNGVLFLGNAVFNTTVQWRIPSSYSMSVIGTRKSIDPHMNTTIKAVTGFPSTTPVVRLGSGTPVYGQFVSDLIIDCNSMTGSTGLYSTDLQEQSGVEHTTILNCPNRGIWINGSGNDGTGPFWAQNYSIDDLYVLPLTAGTGTTIACEFDGKFTSFHQLQGATCGGGSSTSIADAFIFDNIYGGVAEDLNAENAVVGYLVGNANPVTSLVINGMQSSNITTSVASLKSTNSSVVLTGVINGGGSATNTILDPAHLAAPITDFSVALYAYGIGNSFNGFTPVFSTSPYVPARFNSLSLSNGADSQNTLHLDSGRTGPHGGAVTISDRGTDKWSVATDVSNNFQIVDNADSFQAMYFGVGANAPVDIRAHGTGAVSFNNSAGSGTGGTQFYSGGTTPQLVGVFDSAGLHVVNSYPVDFSGAGSMKAPGAILTSPASTVASGQVGIGSTTAGAANCNQAGTLSSVAGCLVINVAGTTRYVPYF